MDKDEKINEILEELIRDNSVEYKNNSQITGQKSNRIAKSRKLKVVKGVSIKPESTKKKQGKRKSNKSGITKDSLLAERAKQNISQRKSLLICLIFLLGLRLFFMNLIVAVIVFWVVFDCPKFTTLDTNILGIVLSFLKFYISAVIVELLGGMIYIVHKVFNG